MTVDDTVTGIEVTFSYDPAFELDQVEVAAWTEDRSAASGATQNAAGVRSAEGHASRRGWRAAVGWRCYA